MNRAAIAARLEAPSPSFQAALISRWAATAENTASGSRNLLQGRMQTRLELFSARAASSYNAGTDEFGGSAICVAATGTPWKRPHGIEVLRITRDAIDLSRLRNGGIPLLDTHNYFSVDKSLGRISNAWIANGVLMAKMMFNKTDVGIAAEGMVERGEIGAVSAGYHVNEWEITDSDGRKIDPELDRIGSDEMLTYTATRWELLELSLATVPSDPLATIRSVETTQSPREGRAVADALARMKARQAMSHRAMAARDGQRFHKDTFTPAPRRWSGFARRPHYQVTNFNN